MSYENQANNPEQYHGMIWIIETSIISFITGGGRSDKYGGKFDDRPRRGGGGPGGERRNNNRRGIFFEWQILKQFPILEYNQDDNNSYNKPRGGGGQNYNRDRPQDYGNKRPQHYNRDRGDEHHHDFRRAEPAKIDADNKFFRGHDLQSNEFNIRFMKCEL